MTYVNKTGIDPDQWEKDIVDIGWPDGMSADDWPDPERDRKNVGKGRRSESRRMEEAWNRRRRKKLRRLSFYRVLYALLAFYLYKIGKEAILFDKRDEEKV